MKPVRGGGSDSALTITSWSALATTTRSRRPSGVVSSSSAVRRSTDLRGPIRTMRASAPGAPVMSPTSDTRSPTTTDLRPSSRARIAVMISSSESASSRTQPYRPRSTVITSASMASSCFGRVRVRGREERPGRIRTSSSSYSRWRAGSVSSSR
jgi:hypothetical protein